MQTPCPYEWNQKSYPLQRLARASIKSIVVIQFLTRRQEYLRLDSYSPFRRFYVTCPVRFNKITIASIGLTPPAVDNDDMATEVIVVYSRFFLISPWKLLRTRDGVELAESGKGCRVLVLAFALVTHEHGGGCGGLEGFGGRGYEGAKGVVVEEKGE